MGEVFEGKNIDILIENLKSRLLAWETDNIRAVREKAESLAKELRGKEGSREEITKLRELYQDVTQAYSHDDDAMVGIMFASALILKDYGADEEFFDEIGDALDFARGRGLKEVGDLLEEIYLS